MPTKSRSEIVDFYLKRDREKTAKKDDKEPKAPGKLKRFFYPQLGAAASSLGAIPLALGGMSLDKKLSPEEAGKYIDEVKKQHGLETGHGLVHKHNIFSSYHPELDHANLAENPRQGVLAHEFGHAQSVGKSTRLGGLRKALHTRGYGLGKQAPFAAGAALLSNTETGDKIAPYLPLAMALPMVGEELSASARGLRDIHKLRGAGAAMRALPGLAGALSSYVGVPLATSYVAKKLVDQKRRANAAAKHEKKAAIGKAILAGLLDVKDLSAEAIARQAGNTVRRVTAPAAAAGGTAYLVQRKEKKEKKKQREAEAAHPKEASAAGKAKDLVAKFLDKGKKVQHFSGSSERLLKTAVGLPHFTHKLDSESMSEIRESTSDLLKEIERGAKSVSGSAIQRVQEAVRKTPITHALDHESAKKTLTHLDDVLTKFKSVNPGRLAGGALLLGGGLALGTEGGKFVGSRLRNAAERVTDRALPSTSNPHSGSSERMAKQAFFEGFKRRDEEKKQRRHAEAKVGFEMAAHDMNNIHPLPHQTLRAWRSELSPDKHTKMHEGYNHFSDKFNPWLKTPEGEAWNNAQAEKHRRSEKTAFARGFERAVR